jgi:HPt (histidine-containing phosphotransfer) domain-containing protein
MSRKVICTRPDPHPSGIVAGDEALPRLLADADGNALPPLSGGADARQPGETASRLPRIIPAEPESPICWKRFAVLKSLFSATDFSATISLYLLNIDLHLTQIARSRACRDFGAAAREAHDIGRIAGNLGAIRVEAAAHLLERACHTGDHAATYGLLSDLSCACDEAGTALNGWLALSPAERGA